MPALGGGGEITPDLRLHCRATMLLCPRPLPLGCRQQIVGEARPNVRYEPLTEAGARPEQTLEAVGSIPLSGKAIDSVHNSKPDPMPCSRD